MVHYSSEITVNLKAERLPFSSTGYNINVLEKLVSSLNIALCRLPLISSSDSEFRYIK